MRCVLAIVLTFFVTQADAGVTNTERHPTTSTIPCDGVLDEFYTEGGNVSDIFFGLILLCQGRNKIEWVLQASASCSSGAVAMGSHCSVAAAEPIARFHGSGSDDRTHVYNLVRYVFARSCVSVPVTTRALEALTNKVRSTSSEPNIVCTQISTVDGTSGENFSELPPSDYKYVKVTTTGNVETTVESPGNGIANVPSSSSSYSLANRGAKMERQ